jgi:hypothetical protein
MKKWFVGIFVFAFIFSLAAFATADEVGNGGTCADSISDGYEWCTARFYVGDGVSGGADDYEFNWQVYWKATTSSKVYVDYGVMSTSFVDSGNDDYIYAQYFQDPYTADGSCVNKKMYGLLCYPDYGRSLVEISSNYPYAQAWMHVKDPENANMFYFYMNLKPTS